MQLMQQRQMRLGGGPETCGRSEMAGLEVEEAELQELLMMLL
jgi:hypothetical protein